MRWAKSNILERINTSWPLVKVTMILLRFITMILNVFIV